MRTQTLPHNPDAEAAVLCSIIKRPSLADDLGVWMREEHFYIPAHSVLFKLFCELHAAHPIIDFLAAKERLKNAGQLAEVGGVEYLDQIWEFVPTAENWEHYAKQVRQCYQRRAVITECNALIERMYDPSLDADEATIEVAEKVFTRLAAQNPKPQRTFKEVVMSTVETIAKRFENRDNPIDLVRFGIVNLDEAIGGLQTTDSCLVCGKTSDGKSALAGLAIDYAASRGMPVAVFSLEMDAEQLVERMFARKGMVSFKRIRTGFLAEMDFPRLTNAAEKMVKFPIFIEDAFTMNINGIVSRCRQLHAKHGLKLIVVDYLQLVTGGDDTRDESREREVASVSNKLKKLAGELKVPVIALSQLNDEGKIRESRAPSHDADVILSLITPDAKNNPDARDVLIAKQRNGPRGQRIPVQFVGEYMDFKPIERREEPQGHHGGNGHRSNGENGHHRSIGKRSAWQD